MTIFFYEAVITAAPTGWDSLDNTDIFPLSGNFAWGATTLYSCTELSCCETYISNPRSFCNISAGASCICYFLGTSDLFDACRCINNPAGSSGYVYQSCQLSVSCTASGASTSQACRKICYKLNNCHNTTDSVLSLCLASVYHCNYNLYSYAYFGYYIKFCDGSTITYPGVGLGAAACQGSANITRTNILFCIDYSASCICYCDNSTSYQCPLPSCHICDFGYCVYNCGRGHNNWGNSCSYTILGTEAWSINCGRDLEFSYCREGSICCNCALPAPMDCAGVFLKNGVTLVRGANFLITQFDLVNENGTNVMTPFAPASLTSFSCICNTSKIKETYSVSSCLVCGWGWSISSETCLDANNGCLVLGSSYTGAASCLDSANSYIYLWRA